MPAGIAAVGAGGAAAAQWGVAVELLYPRRGGDGDAVEASKWYRLAAEQGDVSAMGRLGSLYYGGVGVPRDYVLGHMWTNLAASRDNPRGVGILDPLNRVTEKMTPTQIAEAERLASEWKPKTWEELQ